MLDIFNRYNLIKKLRKINKVDINVKDHHGS